MNANCVEYREGTNNMEGQFWGGQCACVEQSWKRWRTMSDNSVAVNPQPGGLRHHPSLLGWATSHGRNITKLNKHSSFIKCYIVWDPLRFVSLKISFDWDVGPPNSHLSVQRYKLMCLADVSLHTAGLLQNSKIGLLRKSHFSTQQLPKIMPSEMEVVLLEPC